MLLLSRVGNWKYINSKWNVSSILCQVKNEILMFYDEGKNPQSLSGSQKSFALRSKYACSMHLCTEHWSTNLTNAFNTNYTQWIMFVSKMINLLLYSLQLIANTPCDMNRGRESEEKKEKKDGVAFWSLCSLFSLEQTQSNVQNSIC